MERPSRMRDPYEVDHYELKSRDRLEKILEMEDRGDMVEQWYEQAKEMRSEVRAAHRVVVRECDDEEVLEILTKVSRALEKNWKAVDRAHRKYAFARRMAGSPELPNKDRPRYQDEWLLEAGVLAGRMYMMTNAWNTYRKYADAV